MNKYLSLNAMQVICKLLKKSELLYKTSCSGSRPRLPFFRQLLCMNHKDLSNLIAISENKVTGTYSLVWGRPWRGHNLLCASLDRAIAFELCILS